MIRNIKSWKYNSLYILVGFAMFLLAACGSKQQTGLELSKDSSTGTAVQASDSVKEDESGVVQGTEAQDVPDRTQPETITVYVCGAVNQPGLYVLSGTARMAEAVEAAQGMTAEADRDILNLAQYMTDGQMIRVPFLGEGNEEASAAFSKDSSEESGDNRIDLNSADSQELQTIPGIGKSKADAIIQYREEKGKFEKIEDIMQINGIKEASFKKMEPYICVR